MAHSVEHQRAMSETPLEMEQRHVVEGVKRIARQEALMAELTRDGHLGLLPAAHTLLAQLRDTVALSEKRAAHLQTKAGGGTQD